MPDWRPAAPRLHGPFWRLLGELLPLGRSTAASAPCRVPSNPFAELKGGGAGSGEDGPARGRRRAWCARQRSDIALGAGARALLLAGDDRRDAVLPRATCSSRKRRVRLGGHRPRGWPPRRTALRRHSASATTLSRLGRVRGLGAAWRPCTGPVSRGAGGAEHGRLRLTGRSKAGLQAAGFRRGGLLAPVIVARGGLTRPSTCRRRWAARESRGAREWRVHFHVPIFLDQLQHFSTTQDFLRQIPGAAPRASADLAASRGRDLHLGRAARALSPGAGIAS